MRVNGKTVVTNGTFAYDGCHKIYVCATDEETRMMRDEFGYDILPVSELERTYVESCPLKFIDSADLMTMYVGQGEEAEFDYEEDE